MTRDDGKQMIGIRYIIIFATVVILTACSGHATYYIAPSGNDLNPGTSAGKPWKSLEKVNATTFKPGDRILFQSGGSWSGQLHPKGSGAPGKPIEIGMYGLGAKPAINGDGISGPAACPQRDELRQGPEGPGMPTTMQPAPTRHPPTW